MNHYVLHLLSPSRAGQPAIIAGNREALYALKLQLERVFGSGAASTQFYASDGEPFVLTVIHEPDMAAVYTAYRDEPCPARSLREQRPMQQLVGGAGAMAAPAGSRRRA